MMAVNASINTRLTIGPQKILPGMTFEKRILLSFLDNMDSSHISGLDIKCFSRTFKELMYDASEVMISNFASCNFFWCELIVPASTN